MRQWTGLLVPAALAAVLAACGADAGTAPTTTAPPTPITFTLSVNDSGGVLQVRPGDEVVPRLPLTGIEDQGWMMTMSPNPAVLGGGDDLLFFPSETGQGGVAYHEFTFIAVGPGRTTVTLTHGFQQFTFTVQVAERG
jgi:hypothetical protein